MSFKIPKGDQLVYTPHPNFSGTDSFTYMAIDTGGASVTGTAQVTVISMKEAPVAVDDAVETAEDTAVTTGNVLANDTNVDGDRLQMIGFTQTANGTMVYNNNGTFTYTPQTNFNGQDSFTYTVSDGNGGTATGTVIITVTPVNDAPVVHNEAVSTNVGTAVDITVLANDVDDNVLMVVSVTQGVYGMVAITANGTVQYTPTPSFLGQDSFTYTVSDSRGGTATGTITVTVAYPPVAVGDTVQAAEDTVAITGNVLANDTDTNSGGLRVRGFTPATNGVVIYNGDGTFTYIPKANFNGTDRFTYTVTDSIGLFAAATVTVIVTAVNDAPVAKDLSVTTEPDTVVTITLTGSDADGDPLIFAIATGPVWGSISGTVPFLTYTPNANFVGTDKFTYTVTDSSGLSTTATVTITVTGLVAAYGFNEGSGTRVADASSNANDGTISGATWTPEGKFGGALSFDGVSNWVTIAAAPSLDLVTGMTLEAWVYPTVVPNGWRAVILKEKLDGIVYSIYASSDPNTPTAGIFIGDQILYGGSQLTANIWTHLAATYDSTTLRLYINGVEVARRAQTGPVQVSTNSLRIGGNRVWREYFQGRIDEVRIYNRALTASEIRRDMQTPVAPPPVAAYSFDEGQGTTVADLSGHANHGTIAGATWTPQGRFGTALSFDGVSHWVTIEDTPSLALTTGLTLEAWVYPTEPGEGWHTVLMKEHLDEYVYYLDTYSEVNNPVTGMFIAGEQGLFGEEGLPTNAWTHLTATYDGTTQRLYINGVEVARLAQTGRVPVSSGPLRIGGNSIWGEYFQGTIDEVRIYNRALTASEIRADMYTPVAPPTTATTGEDGSIDITVLTQGTAMGGTTPTVVSISQGNNGTVAITATDTVRYTPNSNFNGQDRFTYTVRDANGGTATSGVSVTITAGNDAPVAIGQSVITMEATPVEITLRGSDVDGDTLTFSVVTGPFNGTVSGTPPLLTYTSKVPFTGSDSFTFRVSDSMATSAPATVSLTIRLLNGGFESGDFTGWSTIGETRIERATFGSGPTEGAFQALLSTAGRVEEPGKPGGNAVPVSDLETFLGLPAGSLDDIRTGAVIEGSAIRRTFTARAGDVVSFDWNFLTEEYTNLPESAFPPTPDMNDLAFVVITPLSPPVDRLADTFWMFSLSQTAFFSETGFRRFSFTIPTTGTYTLGIGVVDVGDERGLSGLLIDNLLLTPSSP